MDNGCKYKSLVQTERRFTGLEAVSNQSGDQMSHEFDRAAMAGVFNL